MRPPLVVVVDPGRDLRPGVIKTEEQALVKKLVAHPAIEALTEAVLHRLPRRDEMPDDIVVVGPGEHGVRSELSSVVGDDHAGLATRFDQRRQFARHTQAGDPGVGDRRQAFPRHVVDDVEDPKSPAAGELVVDEIQRPAGVGDRLDGDRRPRPHGTPPRPPLAHRKAFFAIEPVDAVDPGRLSLLAKQDKQPSVAEALALVGEVTQLQSKLRIRRPAGPVADHLAIGIDDGAGPPF